MIANNPNLFNIVQRGRNPNVKQQNGIREEFKYYSLPESFTRESTEKYRTDVRRNPNGEKS
jgi:hypothetical protein